jgi:biotin carboxyl carrier protein
MENEIKATRAGTVTEIHVEPGQAVEAGQLLAVVDD